MPVIKAENVMKRGDWNSESQHPQEPRMVPNKETSMDWVEHQRIVAEAASLVSASGVPDSLQNLKLALRNGQDGDEKSSVYVSKGIHQPHTNPHIQLQTETHTRSGGIWGNAFIQTYHLNVSAVEEHDIDGMTDRFSWKGVQFTTGSGGVGERWPEMAAVVTKKRMGTPGRRNSVSGAAFADRVKQIADEAKVAAEVEAFDKICTAFEQLHKTKPIDRGIRTQKRGWGPLPTHEVQKADGTGSVKFNYDGAQKSLTLVA